MQGCAEVTEGLKIGVSILCYAYLGHISRYWLQIVKKFRGHIYTFYENLKTDSESLIHVFLAGLGFEVQL